MFLQNSLLYAFNNRNLKEFLQILEQSDGNIRNIYIEIAKEVLSTPKSGEFVYHLFSQYDGFYEVKNAFNEKNS